MPASPDTHAVFVVGSPRSGTSVLAWALAQHPELATGPEMDLPFLLARLCSAQAPADAIALDKLPPLEAALQQALRRPDGWLAKHAVGRDELLAALGRGYDALARERSGGKRWIDSTPAAALACPQLAKLFPAARFLHILRDGRATVSSMVNSGFDVRVAKDFDFACETWATYALRGRAFAEAEPARCLELRQEELAADPEAVVARVLPFLECAPHEGVVALLRRGRINSSWGNASADDLRRAKDHAVVPEAPWRAWSGRQKRSFTKLAGRAMEVLGYSLELD
ncbi:MAG: sulfotransferase [Planctomycetes bacterium]|nr:sulfotransferase [Planctomycetota bacterium]